MEEKVEKRVVERKLKVVKSGRTVLLYLPSGDGNEEIVSRDYVEVEIEGVRFPATIHRIRDNWNFATLTIPKFAKQKLKIKERIGQEVLAKIILD